MPSLGVRSPWYVLRRSKEKDKKGGTIPLLVVYNPHNDPELKEFILSIDCWFWSISCRKMAIIHNKAKLNILFFSNCLNFVQNLNLVPWPCSLLWLRRSQRGLRDFFQKLHFWNQNFPMKKMRYVTALLSTFSLNLSLQELWSNYHVLHFTFSLYLVYIWNDILLFFSNEIH